ncbi:PTS system galactitol-specific transporter subunit IIC [Klebsiella michiganensis]|uniref:PTS system galactitol-specific transporter subunit IIC n=1 Tax=Klebsiella michiganensis TaxID=1134687 RepID=A0A7H4PHB2_9ENTR|nr:PTS system galactitol-specific transporter subunit IIC [Klebsiella michiganensis]
MFSEIMRYILDLGPTVMLPIVIIIFSKILGMKLGDCFKSGLHIGIGFVGIGLVIGLMLDSIGPAAKAMAEHFQINLHVIDIGWPGSSPMTWASQIALVAIPIAIAVNIFMLVTRMTRVRERRHLEHLAYDLYRRNAAYRDRFLLDWDSWRSGACGFRLQARRLVCEGYPRLFRPRWYCYSAR